MKFWIARHEYGNISLFKRKPHIIYDPYTKSHHWTLDCCDGDYMPLPDGCFPEVTFENSPQEVELIIKK